jgi:hypothetical protein
MACAIEVGDPVQEADKLLLVGLVERAVGGGAGGAVIAMVPGILVIGFEAGVAHGVLRVGLMTNSCLY